MFELEIPHRRLERSALDDDARARFRDPEAQVEAFGLCSFEEHCTECAMPACYATCDLYESRPDGKCRRFIGGLAVIPDVPTLQGYAVRVSFKRWGQLLGKAHPQLVPASRARQVERALASVDRAVSRTPGFDLPILGRPGMPGRLERRLKRSVARRLGRNDLTPDYFLVEVWNPGPATPKLTVTIRASEGPKAQTPFQTLIEVAPGFQRMKVPYASIAPHVPEQGTVDVSLDPNLLHAEDEGLELIFGSLAFVRDAAARGATRQEKGVKVVVWDLDNTVWKGVLVEDGPDGVELDPRVRDTMEELDRRGILNSVASKNDAEPALEQLRRCGLLDLVLFPQVHWGPKSGSLRRIVSDFNVGADTVVFVDDQPFEREEVRAAVPEIRVFDAAEVDSLLTRPEFDPPRTTEAGRRRELYRTQRERHDAHEDFGGDYLAFLRDCGITVTIDADPAARIDRLHELIQRTNQMNFSGNRYEREALETLLADPAYEPFALQCEDRFGEYGLVGFGLVRREDATLVDLAFSCRVQAKRVEHAFLSYLLERYRAAGHETFRALYRHTERNAPAGQVFDDLGFERVDERDGVRELHFDLSRAIPSDGLIDVRVAT